MKEFFSRHSKLLITLGLVLVAAFIIVKLLVNQGERLSGGTGNISSITGSINFNGLKPSKGNEDLGEVVILQRKQGESSYSKTGVTLPLSDGANWVWNQAMEDVTYDIRADLYLGGTMVKSSEVVTTSAPASNVELGLYVTIEDVPDHVLSQKPVSVSGTVEVNGHVPENSTVVIHQRMKGETDFVPATEAFLASDGVRWVWKEALAGKEYEIKGILSSGSTVIGVSNPIKTVAPAENEVIKITSGANVPGGVQETISGKVYLRGSVVDNSDILMLQRKVGEAEFTPFQRVAAVDGVKFSWSEALVGVEYEITAALQVNEQNVSTGNVLRVAAPAKGEKITIDSQLSLTAPASKPTITCGSKDSAGGFNATIKFNSIENAGSYWLEAGTETSNKDLLAKKVKASGSSSPEESVYVKGGETHYTRYAYSYCTDCDFNNTSNWSGYSPTNGFKCE